MSLILEKVNDSYVKMNLLEIIMAYIEVFFTANNTHATISDFEKNFIIKRPVSPLRIRRL